MNDIVKKINILRNEKGWSVYKLAQEAGLTAQTVPNWFDNNSMPTIIALEQVCEAFNISLAKFFADGGIVV